MTTEIVGVIGDVLKDGLDTKPQPEIYLALNKLDTEHAITREINLVIRTSGDPNAFASSLRSIVRESSRRQRWACRHSVEPGRQFSERTAILDGGAWLRLPSRTGHRGHRPVWGAVVQRFSAAQGNRDPGGARRHRRDLIGLVVRQGLTVTLVGLLAGVLIAALAARQLQPMLFGIAPLICRRSSRCRSSS